MMVGKMQNHRDHDQVLTTLLHTVRACNVRLNYEKVQYKQNKVEFFGETYTVDSYKPAQSKVKTTVEMPPRNCKKQVQSFMGMVNYLSKFSACLSELAEPICELSKEKGPFNWGPEHEEYFKMVKKEIANAPILAYYNPRKTTDFTDRCQYKRTWSLMATRWKTCLLHKQSPDRGTKRLCGNWTRVLGSGFGSGEMPSLSLCQPLYSWNRSKTALKPYYPEAWTKQLTICRGY